MATLPSHVHRLYHRRRRRNIRCCSSSSGGGPGEQGQPPQEAVLEAIFGPRIELSSS